MIIVGAGINHWFNSDTIYRAVLNLVLLVGAQGVNGGGWAHYVGQEKLRPAEGWQTIATAKDWEGVPKLQNGTSFFTLRQTSGVMKTSRSVTWLHRSLLRPATSITPITMCWRPD